MTTFIVNWCKVMFTPTKDSIEVRTAQCQSGVINTPRCPSPVTQEEPEVISSFSLAGRSTIPLEENTIYLNRTESSFINKEVERLLKAKLAETQRKKKEHVPLPPEPGKVAYAVYQ